MPYPLASPGEDENDSALSHLSVLQRPRARTMIDSRSGRMADLSAIQGGSLYPLPKGSSSRSPPPQMRLQLSIPPLLSKSGSITAGSTPQSESPETPASVTSPIAGVVDLTKYVATTSKEAVAHGGLSDIYLGEWYRTEESWVAGEKEVVRVSSSPHIVFPSLVTYVFQGGDQASSNLHQKGPGRGKSTEGRLCQAIVSLISYHYF